MFVMVCSSISVIVGFNRVDVILFSSISSLTGEPDGNMVARLRILTGVLG